MKNDYQNIQDLDFVDELFYSDDQDFNENSEEIQLENQEAIHCIAVLRYKLNQQIFITNGNGLLVEGVIVAAKKGLVTVLIKKRFKNLSSLLNHLPVLYIGLLKNKDRIEWLVEKSTEIGVSKIVFVNTKHSEKNKINLDRLKNVSISAMKQSKRLFLPQIEFYKSLDDALSVSNGVSVLAHERVESMSMHPYDFLSKYSNSINTQFNYWIGPEGGFTEDEVNKVIKSSTNELIYLGTVRLRAETAALTLLQLDLIRRLGRIV